MQLTIYKKKYNIILKTFVTYVLDLEVETEIRDILIEFVFTTNYDSMKEENYFRVP